MSARIALIFVAMVGFSGVSWAAADGKMNANTCDCTDGDTDNLCPVSDISICCQKRNMERKDKPVGKATIDPTTKLFSTTNQNHYFCDVKSGSNDICTSLRDKYDTLLSEAQKTEKTDQREGLKNVTADKKEINQTTKDQTTAMNDLIVKVNKLDSDHAGAGLSQQTSTAQAAQSTADKIRQQILNNQQMANKLITLQNSLIAAQNAYTATQTTNNTSMVRLQAMACLQKAVPKGTIQTNGGSVGNIGNAQQTLNAEWNTCFAAALQTAQNTIATAQQAVSKAQEDLSNLQATMAAGTTALSAMQAAQKQADALAAQQGSIEAQTYSKNRQQLVNQYQQMVQQNKQDLLTAQQQLNQDQQIVMDKSGQTATNNAQNRLVSQMKDPKNGCCNSSGTGSIQEEDDNGNDQAYCTETQTEDSNGNMINSILGGVQQQMQMQQLSH